MSKKEPDITKGPLSHQDLIIDRIKKIFDKKAEQSDSKESGSNSYAKNNQEAIKKLKG
jgi:hypothetical protein